MLYRLRIYSCGDDGCTPPMGEQTCLFDVIVDAEEVPPEGLWPTESFAPTDVCLTLRGYNGEQPCGAYHSTPPGRTASVFGIGTADRIVHQFGGLRAHWEAL